MVAARWNLAGSGCGPRERKGFRALVQRLNLAMLTNMVCVASKKIMNTNQLQCSPPLRHFIERGCVAGAMMGRRWAPLTRCTLPRNTAGMYIEVLVYPEPASLRYRHVNLAMRTRDFFNAKLKLCHFDIVLCCSSVFVLKRNLHKAKKYFGDNFN